jgi:hypothetical protein
MWTLGVVIIIAKSWFEKFQVHTLLFVETLTFGGYTQRLTYMASD